MTDFTKVFGDKLLKGETEVNTAEALAGLDAIGIYFSAHWCPPCRGFTPKLAVAHKKLQEAGKKFEIVFVSSDGSDNEFKSYFAEMPWLALPYDKRDLADSLNDEHDCEGIPHLVIIDGNTGKTINTEGRGALSTENFIEDFPYHPKSSYDLSESMEGLTGKDPVLLVFTDACEAETKKEISGVVRTFADSIKAKGETHFAKYFTANGSSGIESQMRPSFGMSIIPPKKHDKPLTLMVPEIDNVGLYSGGWGCDGCGKTCPASVANWRNKDDQFDMCDACYQKVYVEDATPQVGKPQMFVLNFTEKKFWAPKEGEEAVTDENIQKLLDNHQAGYLAESILVM